jgi:hypothetical protein
MADGSGRRGHTAGVEHEGHYWDHERAEWVRYPEPVLVEIPPQAMGLEAEQEADVRSG